MSGVSIWWQGCRQKYMLIMSKVKKIVLVQVKLVHAFQIILDSHLRCICVAFPKTINCHFLLQECVSFTLTHCLGFSDTFKM